MSGSRTKNNGHESARVLVCKMSDSLEAAQQFLKFAVAQIAVARRRAKTMEWN
jgi:hypothetical protein